MAIGSQRPAHRLATLAACVSLGACGGQIFDPNHDPAAPVGPGGAAPAPGSFTAEGNASIPPPAPTNEAPTPVGPPPAGAADSVFFGSATRRLTRVELRQTLLDLVGVDLHTELGKFPEDFAEAGDVFAFDNNYLHQAPSPALIEAARNLADKTGAALGDPAVRARLVPCTPSGPGDEACLRRFLETFGRRALRRPLSLEEIERMAGKLRPLAVAANDFQRAVVAGVRVFVQDPEFLYRMEVGQPVTGRNDLVKLTGPEMATRLSYLLWGTSPDDALMAEALSGPKLGSAAAVRAVATRMLADPRARRAVQRFHALLFGYERQPPPASLAAPMLAETSALIDKVVFTERRPWLDLFRAKETYLDAPLAAHYGLPAPSGGPGWVPYGDGGRQGILAHASFLGVERKHTDTSPTMRGQFIRTRLLCQAVPPPPPELMVDIDAVPSEGNCKSDRYGMWQREGCRGCHTLMDPIGFGLENYDRAGKWRTVAPADAGKAGCEISGRGQLTGMGNLPPDFTGLGGLADRLAESGGVEACLTTQLASYVLGRSPRRDETDLVARLGAAFARNQRLDDLLLDFVALPGFGYRLAE